MSLKNDRGIQSIKKRVVVRKATIEDAAQLARVYNTAFGPVNAQEVRRWLSSKSYPRETIVAVADRVVVSAVTIYYFDLMIEGTPIKTGAVAGVATHWDYRRQGLSTRLLVEANKRIKAKGISNATLFTSISLPAIRIYKRIGYRPMKRRTKIAAIYDPVEELKAIFKTRSTWLPRMRHTKSIIKDWTERVLLESDGWRATITADCKKFVVQPGKRGKPSITVRGNTKSIFECFWQRHAYDGHLKAGRMRVTGDPEACALWRRIVTMEWVE